MNDSLRESGSSDGDDASPRTFLLALLQAHAADVPVQILIRAAALFEIDENRTRVALHRLRNKGLIDSHERGTYRAAGIRALNAEASGWRHALCRLRPWGGEWIGVHTAPLPRADKTVARRRDRATRIVGLRELQPGLLVRPDNLTGGVDATRERLIALGLEAEAAVFRLGSLGPLDKVARSLWDGLFLDQRYRVHIERLEQLSARASELSLEDAARQLFTVGGRAIQDIVVDPLLPEPLVDPELRARFVQTMVAFDDLGRATWSQVLGDPTLCQAPIWDPGPTGPRSKDD